MVKVEQIEYQVRIDQHNPNHYIPADMGLSKGDLITFNDEGSPVRFPVSNVADKCLLSDPTSPTGLKWGTVSGGSSGGGSALITLKNNSGSTILTGTVVTFDEEGGALEVRKATSSDGINLFVSSDDYATGADMACYATPNTICNVLCTSDAVNIGDNICVSSTSGMANAGDYPTIGVAVTAKASGETGYVKVLLSGNFRYSVGDTDLEDGVSLLPKGHLYFYYDDSEPEVEEEA